MRTFILAAALLVSSSAMAQGYYGYPTTAYQLPPRGETTNQIIDRQANFARNMINRQIIQGEIEDEHRRLHRMERLDREMDRGYDRDYGRY